MFDAVRKMYGCNTALLDGVSAGTNALVAAKVGHRCFVDSITVSWSAAAGTLVIKDGSTAITGTFTLPAAGGTFTIYDPGLKTSTNSALNMVTTGAGTVSFLVRFHFENAVA